MKLKGHPYSYLDAHLNVFQNLVMTSRAMKRIVLLLNIVQRYGINDTLQCVTFVYFYVNV